MMTSRILTPIFQCNDPAENDAPFTAMECHDGCRAGSKNYPCRTIRTKDYVYIHNFEPTRCPSGSPDASVCARSIPFGEIDTSPTKTFMMEHRNEHGVTHLAELAFRMRPAEELYDLKNDPHQMVNFAGSTAMAETQASLRRRLFSHLEKTRDPRVVGGVVDWNYYPYYGKTSTKRWSVDEKPRQDTDFVTCSRSILASCICG
ncbi:alkaline phosphatase family protein [Rubripirellula reticaptiva]|uniref:hypothetical protein n=1 Tax=Rubripirellula reticaptiva TaxID=2528013 RepID=UPI0011B35D0A|nr:hypothetical protein [Rubripirellula reticaptiva]